MNAYIDAHRDAYGVEPICRVMAIAPSSYYAAKSRPPSARSVSDATLADVIGRVHRANFGVYGVRKVWKALGRLGIEAGRDQVARIMRGVGLQALPAPSGHGRPGRHRSASARPTSSSACSRLPPPTACGSPT